MTRFRLGPVLLLLGMAGCAPAAEPPLTSLGDRACDAQPFTGDAIPVPFDSGSGATARFGATTRCLVLPDAARPGGVAKVTYAAFRLPDAPAPYAVTVASLPTLGTVVPPRLAVLDEAGRVTRTVALDGFQSGLFGFRTGLRIQPGERTVVVEADPARIGQYTLLRLGLRDSHWPQVAARGIVIVPVVIPDGPAQQTEAAATLALNGTVRVTAAPIRTLR
jgi:hypothetical protein